MPDRRDETTPPPLRAPTKAARRPYRPAPRTSATLVAALVALLVALADAGLLAPGLRVRAGCELDVAGAVMGGE